MSHRKFTSSELEALQEALGSDFKRANIRLREGEYQFTLAQAIAGLQLELTFPDVKDVIRKMSGEKETDDVQIIRKVQTILKKMEKSSVVKILPKKKPWELQRYILSSFKFQDAENSMVTFATDAQVSQSRQLVQLTLRQEGSTVAARRRITARIFALAFVVVASYAAVLWSLVQPVANPFAFVPAFTLAVVCSIALGKILSE